MKAFHQTKLALPKVKDYIDNLMDVYRVTRKQAKDQYNQLKQDEIWVNDLYQVNIARGDNVPNNLMGVAMIHLSVKRLDKGAIHDWRHMQSIKDSLVGQDNEGFELYPSASRLVDAANQFHMFVFEDPTLRLPIGWAARAVESVIPEGSGATQRPITEEEVDEDHTQALMAADGKVDIYMILKAQAIMDGADVPQEDRIVLLKDPDTGEMVSSETDPERVLEIIQKYVDAGDDYIEGEDEKHMAEVADAEESGEFEGKHP